MHMLVSSIKEVSTEYMFIHATVYSFEYNEHTMHFCHHFDHFWLEVRPGICLSDNADSTNLDYINSKHSTLMYQIQWDTSRVLRIRMHHICLYNR